MTEFFEMNEQKGKKECFKTVAKNRERRVRKNEKKI
jgi:hypothetical protein